MKITRYLVFALLGVLSLCACKLDLSSKINIGDLNRVALSQEEGVTGRGTIKLEVGSMDHIARMKAGFLPRFLRAIFRASKFCHVNRWEWNLILLQGFKFRFCILEGTGLKKIIV